MIIRLLENRASECTIRSQFIALSFGVREEMFQLVGVTLQRKKEEFESQAHHGDVKAGGGSVEPPIEEPNLNVI